MKWLRWIGIVLGLALAAGLVHEVGWRPIQATLGMLGWSYGIVLAYPVTWMTLNTLGWRCAFHPQFGGLPLKILLSIRLAGEAFNSLLPSGYIGGEPVKASLLTRWMPLREAASSVLVAKAAQSIGLLLFIGLGLALGLPPGASAADRVKVWIALGVLAAGVGMFTFLLANRSFSRFGRFLHQLTKWSWIGAQEQRLSALDESLGNFYRDCKGRFTASFIWHAAGWIAGMFEVAIIFHLLGATITWRQAWFIGALAQLGAVLGLVSPGGLGFYEGGHYMAAVLLGLPPSLGVSVSLIRRIREIFWNALGLYFFHTYSKEKI